MLNLVKIKVDRAGAIEIPDYKRGAWFTEKRYGVEVKNINTRFKACFIVYQSKYDPADVLVELKFFRKFIDVMRPEIVSISPQIIKAFVDGTGYDYQIVERGGHIFFRGLVCDCTNLLNPSEELCLNTKALKFMESIGCELAVAAAFPDKIHNFEAAAEVDMMLNCVGKFVQEIEDDKGIIKSRKNAIAKNLDYNRTQLESVERSMNECHETNREARETLLKFGINPDKYHRLKY